MKIERDYLPTMTLTEFADKHDLTICIRKRPISSQNYWHRSFFCFFKNVEIIKNGSFRRFCVGDGDTEEEALLDYIDHINGSKIILEIHTPNERSITVPMLSGI